MRSKTDPRPKATRPKASPPQSPGLIAKSPRAPRSARAKTALDNRSHRTFKGGRRAEGMSRSEAEGKGAHAPAAATQ
jgi:hypothetical protein